MATDKQMTKAIETVAQAAPKTPSALRSIFNSVLFPLLPGLLVSLLSTQKGKPRIDAVAIQTRDVLVEAYPLDE
jgi:hypothetical protein